MLRCLTRQPMSALFAVLFGKWTDHVKSWRNSELGDRIMYITYEEMVQVKTISMFSLKGFHVLIILFLFFD